MKRILLLVMIMEASVFAVEQKELMPLIEEASAKRESAYVEVRNKITGYGTNALPLLAEIGTDKTLPWQQQLVARICYERIERGKEIKKLLQLDWYHHPNFDPEWKQFLAGPEQKMMDMMVSDLKEVGAWYYYLELVWKMTGEKAKIRERAGIDFWTMWCVKAIRNNPDERIWFLRACTDLFEITPPHFMDYITS